jgi:hypothetical protein
MKKQVDDPEAQCRWLPEKKNKKQCRVQKNKKKK